MIRRLTREDTERFSRLRLLGLELHPQAFSTGADAWRVATREHVGALLEPGDPPDDRFVLGAWEGDNLVGLIGFKRERRRYVSHKGSLWGLFVHPDHRRRGVGTALLETALREARRGDGLEYIRLMATTTSEDAMRLFEAHGFVSYGVEEGGLCVEGVAFDQTFLRHDLG